MKQKSKFVTKAIKHNTETTQAAVENQYWCCLIFENWSILLITQQLFSTLPEVKILGWFWWKLPGSSLTHSLLLWPPVKVGLLLNTWRNCSLHITTGLEIKTFARVYVYLELSVNEKFVTYGTIVKILTTLKSSYACCLIQNLEAVIERVYLPQCFNYKFLSKFDCWWYEISKKNVSHTFFLLRMGN